MSPRPISILHREADPDLVAYCERLLERARAGIVGLMVAAELRVRMESVPRPRGR